MNWKKFIFVWAIGLLFFVAIVSGQDGSANGRAAEQNLDAKYPGLRDQVEELTKATISGDYLKVVDLTYPKVVAMVGGRDKMTSHLANEHRQDKESGFELQAIDVGGPLQIEKVGSQLFAVLPIKLTAKTPDGVGSNDNWLVGISDDAGNHWTFIRGVEQKRFNLMFPGAAAKIRIPN